MRILVVSDTHGDLDTLVRAVNSQPTAEIIVHCGDGEEQAQFLKDNYKDKMVVAVRGNCDWGSSLPVTETFNVLGKKIFVTHGHCYNVKFTHYQLFEEAINQNADILLFGHTHESMTDYEDGLYILNPGSCHGWGATFGYVDITEKGDIVTNVITLK